MNRTVDRYRMLRALVVAGLLGLALPCVAQDNAQQDAPPPPAAPTFKPEEIDQLVAPVALYPDPLLAQIFMASTYPLEIVEAARWQKANPDLKDKALEDALLAQKWDPSVKSLAAFPQVLTMMNEKLDWTQKLGDAFLAQQDDVMLSVQRLRNKAQEAGTLQTTKEQKVIVEEKPVVVSQTVNVDQPPPPPQTIVIQPADPQVVYVPQYNPTTAYGSWPYPSYPPYSYYPPGYVAATSMMSFGVGMMAGAALWGDCDWNDCCGGGGDNVKINVNNYNNFNKTDIKNGNWNHNAEHRKGVGYRDKGSQQRYGQRGQQARNTASRDAFRGRAESGRQEMARSGTSGRGQGAQNKAGGAQNRAGGRDNRASAQNRAGGQRPSQTGQRQAQSQRRDVGATDRQSSSRGNDAFRGTSNSRQQVQRQADRGRSSRQSSFGGGGGRGGGGGSRAGGGRGGGGRSGRR